MSGSRRVRDWQKTDPHLRSHPTFLKFRSRLGVSPVIAHGVLAGLWSFAFDFAHDGDVTRFTPEELSLGVGWDGDAQALVDALSVGFVVDGIIHDWHEWGGALFSTRKSDAERQWDHRNKKMLDLQDKLSQGRGVTMRDNGPEEKREEKEQDQEPPLPPIDEFTSMARASIEGWRDRPDDDRFFATVRRSYPPPQIERVMRELAIHQASANGKRYKDPRLALGKWIKRQKPEAPLSPHLNEPGRWMYDIAVDESVWVPDV